MTGQGNRFRDLYPIQMKILFWGTFAYALLELANYIPHAFVWNFKDYDYYKSFIGLPVFDEVENLLQNPKFAKYMNAYTEYMVWSIPSTILMCLVAITAVINHSIGERKAYKQIIALILFAAIIVLTSVFYTDNFDGRGFFRGYHISIPTGADSFARIAFFFYFLALSLPCVRARIQTNQSGQS